MTRVLELTQGQRMALASIVGEYIRLALWQEQHDPDIRLRGVDPLPLTFFNAGDGTTCSAEELLRLLLEQ